MNTKQWIVLSVAMAVLSLSGLFPPWQYECEKFTSSAGYHFYTWPPEIKNICQTSAPDPAPLPTVQVNENRLFVQSIILFILMAGLVLILKTPRTNLSVSIAVLLFGIGAIGLMLLGLMIRFEI